MNWINRFKTEAEFKAQRRFLPCSSVSYIRELMKSFIQQDEMSHTLPVGTIALYNKESNAIEYVYYTNYNATDYPISNYKPIGIVVIPQDFLGEESEARIISLVNMSTTSPEVGSTNYQYIRWGGYAYDGNSWTYRDVDGLENLSSKYQQFIGTDGELSGQQSSWGYLPSDKFNNFPTIYDRKTGYYYTDGNNQIPSPYNYSWVSRLFGKNKSGADSFLADIDGVANTDVLIAAETLQTTWQTDSAIIHQYNSYDDVLDYQGHFPPALCCRRFHTEGTNAGEWYLPAVGELAFVMPRWNVIKAAFAAVMAVDSTVAVPLDESYHYWSSSEYSQNYAYYLYTYNGYVSDSGKNLNNLVRAFRRLPRI